MQHILVNCNHCGNVLETTTTTKFATCMICDSSLEIMVTSSSYYTRVKLNNEFIQPIPEPTIELEPIIRPDIEQKIIALDELWKPKHSSYLVEDNSDHSAFNIIVVFAGLLILFATPKSIPSLSIIGLVIMILGALGYLLKHNRKSKYLNDKKIYEAERQRLEDQLYLE